MNWWEKDKELIWHPFTQHGLSADPIPVTGAKDALLFAADGKTYIDAISSWWVNTWGHAHPEIVRSVQDQAAKLEQVIFAGFTHEPAVQVAELLQELLPGSPRRIFFSDNGSTSVEVALKIAIQYWHNLEQPRKRIIAFENGYHGDTFGAMSAGKSAFFKAFEPYLFDVVQIPVPNAGNRNELSRQFDELISGGDVAAFIFEPLIQGSGGMRMYDAKYLDELIAAAQQHGVICIADEVMTGIGRTGKPFASDYLQTVPDIICLSKGLTGGFLPLGVTACSPAIFEAFRSTDRMKTFFHGHSYTANPLACSAAIASLKLLEASEAQLQQVVNWQRELSNRLSQHPAAENLRQLGTIVAFEVRSDAQSNYFNNLRDYLYAGSIERGVLLRPLGNTVYVMPPYCITRVQLETVYRTIGEVLDNL